MLLSVLYPESNTYTRDAILAAAAASPLDWHLTDRLKDAELQFSDYDLIDWDSVSKGSVASCYVIRKVCL